MDKFDRQEVEQHNTQEWDTPPLDVYFGNVDLMNELEKNAGAYGMDRRLLEANLLGRLCAITPNDVFRHMLERAYLSALCHCEGKGRLCEFCERRYVAERGQGKE